MMQQDLSQEKAAEFWGNISHRLEKVGDCLVWQGAKNGVGYGHIGRSEAGEATYYNVHKVAYVALVGPIQPGMVIDHLCRNRACAKVAHLELVPMRENSLRGDHPNYRTHLTGKCKRGHEIAGANALFRKDGRKRCKACARRRKNK